MSMSRTQLPVLWAAVAAVSFAALIVAGVILTPGPAQSEPDRTEPSQAAASTGDNADVNSSSNQADPQRQGTDPSALRVHVQLSDQRETSSSQRSGDIWLSVADVVGSTTNATDAAPRVLLPAAVDTLTFDVGDRSRLQLCTSSPEWRPADDEQAWHESRDPSQWCLVIDGPGGRMIDVTMRRP